jgi:biofilm PGA synthesis lipoprotein PgaB
MLTKKRVIWIRISLILLAIIIVTSLLIQNRLRGEGYHYSNQVAVLEYHHIDPQASSYTITPDTFKQHLDALLANHYQVISMNEYIEFLKGKHSVPPDAVVITFDDGYESFYQYAYPVLKDHHMVASNFIIVGDLETNPGIPFLKWNEIEEMYHQGFTFYSHTYKAHDFVEDSGGKLVDPLTNPIYLKDKNRTETEEEYEQRVKADLEQANQIIESKLGAQERLLCFPHGRYNQTLLKLGNETGIQYFFTGIDGLNAQGTTLIKRINAGADNVNADKLMNKLNDETTLLGKLKISLKNYITSRRTSAE